jgi:hypothetical protein
MERSPFLRWNSAGLEKSVPGTYVAFPSHDVALRLKIDTDAGCVVILSALIPIGMW